MFTPVPEGYYDTPAWKRKSFECKRRNGFRCAACGRQFKEWEHFKLEAHHTDEAYQKVPHETPADLIPLCGKRSGRPCHKKGRYSAWEIRRDRKANWWINAIRWASRKLWRATRWLVRLPARLLRWAFGKPSSGAARR